ncbi:hypothetical protein HBI82_035310 [Parastagonospora nodorum]|nr:hypothetical protein HBH46_068820 [Parastagonospora nodorum]KAH4922501.1 hypothetical protein HBI79_175880 [Parastagonospora nodorum]KAH5319765.1 hypothetical protein HBI12_105530 [Parastagonospora nodorum]KAH5663013.1 hypothetical protein HBI23_095550 [Parastagonospora nodorum]KAH5781492.1 hypothetical protein HBI97_102610 [Parastagonospora nodorum]
MDMPSGIIRRIPRQTTSCQTGSASRLFTRGVNPSLKGPHLLDKATIIFTGQTLSRDIFKPYSEHPHFPCIIAADHVSLRGTSPKVPFNRADSGPQL